jgi:hypothetical protein
MRPIAVSTAPRYMPAETINHHHKTTSPIHMPANTRRDWQLSVVARCTRMGIIPQNHNHRLAAIRSSKTVPFQSMMLAFANHAGACNASIMCVLASTQCTRCARTSMLFLYSGRSGFDNVRTGYKPVGACNVALRMC